MNMDTVSDYFGYRLRLFHARLYVIWHAVTVPSWTQNTSI